MRFAVRSHQRAHAAKLRVVLQKKYLPTEGHDENGIPVLVEQR